MTVIQPTPELPPMNAFSGKTIRWTFVDGPMPNTMFEHSFNEDGTVTWRIVDGPHAGANRTEKSYGAEKVNDQTWSISYLAASGHTLTVVLDLQSHHAVAFASNDTTWSLMHGTFAMIT